MSSTPPAIDASSTGYRNSLVGEFRYRPDIDGLRALAVLGVVLYHYDVIGLRGGFVGVDVFFVISGYLITGIIHREIQQGRFSFADFYERRIRRIYPALVTVLLVTVAVGCVVLLPTDLVRLGISTMATLFYVSNALFWRQSGYFEVAADYNPLLHTWSLAVEEQFYIALPILLVVVHRRASGWTKPIIATSAVLSFALCVWVQGIRPSAAFFLTPFRAWELLVGALLALGVMPAIRNHTFRSIASLAALFVLVGSFFWVEAGREFPGWLALPPVLATATLLHAGADGPSVVRNALSVKPLVYLGLISYSLYLWHWPVMVYLSYYNGMHPLGSGTIVLALACSIVLSVCTYRWVEIPTRRRRNAGDRRAHMRVFRQAAVATTVVAAVAASLHVDDGWSWRFDDSVVRADAVRPPSNLLRRSIPYVQCDRQDPFSLDACVVGIDRAPPRVLLWGDSHAMAWAPALDEVLARSGAAGIAAVNSACPPLIGVHNPASGGCYSSNVNVKSQISSGRFNTVVLVASWNSYASSDGMYVLKDDAGSEGNEMVFRPALARTIKFVLQHADTVVLVGPTPGAPHAAPFRLASARANRIAPEPEMFVAVAEAKSEAFWRAAEMFAGNRRVRVVDPAPWFCDETTCRYMDGGELLYRDATHLSLDGAAYVARMLENSAALDLRPRQRPSPIEDWDGS